MKLARMILHLILLIVVVNPWSFTEAPKAEPEKQYWDPTKYEEAIRAFEAADREQPPAKGAIVCIGSSSMKGWHGKIQEDLAPLTVIPRGFGGSNMNEAVYYADRIVIPYQPRAVVLYEGDNDIAYGISPEKVNQEFCAFVEKVHQALPAARIYFLSIKPSPSRWGVWPQMQEANRLIKQECSKNSLLNYVDVAAGMLDADGEVKKDIFLEDNLHLNREGYVIWRDILKPVLMKSELAFEPQRDADGK